MLYTYFVYSKQVLFVLEEGSMAINNIRSDYFDFEHNSVFFPTLTDKSQIVIDIVINKLRGREEHKVCG